MPTVDLRFRITGGPIPADHGYALYGALCRVLPQLHHRKQNDTGSPWEHLAIHPITGRLIGDRQLVLLPESSRLTVRLDSDLIGDVLPVAGKSLLVDGAAMQVGVPDIYPLMPAARLHSRLVAVKGFMEPEPFLLAIQRQLDALGIHGKPEIPKRQGPASLEGHGQRSNEHLAPIRRTLRIRDKQVVGYALAVTELTDEESFQLQEHGLGGRRAFGCGVFVPVKG